jgi:hypothetical protein
LAKLDRRLLAELAQDERFQMVRVPVTPAKWSTWKRYCATAGVAMGRAVAALIDRELVSVFGEANDDGGPVFAARVEEALAAQASAVTSRERQLDAAEQRLRGWAEHLRDREDELSRREQQVRFAARSAAAPSATGVKVGRNERCPCGSGFKYKRCHGT